MGSLAGKSPVKRRTHSQQGPSSKVFQTWGLQAGFHWGKLLLAILIAGMVGLAAWHLLPSPPHTEYVLVMDAGSSGTRMYAYTWRAGAAPGDPPLVEAIPPHAASSKVPRRALPAKRAYQRVETEPGLDRFVGDAQGLKKQSIAPLLRWAEAVVPRRVRPRTPVFLFATAGLRKLPDAQQEALMGGVRSLLRSSPFRFQPDWARIISGEDEGVYGWIALNYLSGAFGSAHLTPGVGDSPMEGGGARRPGSSRRGKGSRGGVRGGGPRSTVGVLDLGGSSLEVAFELDEGAGMGEPRSKDIVNVTVLGSSYSLYVHVHHRYGLNDAFDRSVSLLLDPPAPPRPPDPSDEPLEGKGAAARQLPAEGGGSKRAAADAAGAGRTQEGGGTGGHEYGSRGAVERGDDVAAAVGGSRGKDSGKGESGGDEGEGRGGEGGKALRSEEAGAGAGGQQGGEGGTSEETPPLLSLQPKVAGDGAAASQLTQDATTGGGGQDQGRHMVADLARHQAQHGHRAQQQQEQGRRGPGAEGGGSTGSAARSLLQRNSGRPYGGGVGGGRGHVRPSLSRWLLRGGGLWQRRQQEHHHYHHHQHQMNVGLQPCSGCRVAAAGGGRAVTGGRGQQGFDPGRRAAQAISERLAAEEEEEALRTPAAIAGVGGVGRWAGAGADVAADDAAELSAGAGADVAADDAAELSAGRAGWGGGEGRRRAGRRQARAAGAGRQLRQQRGGDVDGMPGRNEGGPGEGPGEGRAGAASGQLLSLLHPCLHDGYAKRYKRMAIQGVPPDPPEVMLIGRPDHGACSRLAALVVNASQPCAASSCALGAPQPRTPRPFHALTGFYVVHHFFGMRQGGEWRELGEAGREFCGKSWGQVEEERGDEIQVDRYCFRAPYVTTLLDQGLGVGEGQVQIGRPDVGWTLGAAVAEGSRLGFPGGDGRAAADAAQPSSAFPRYLPSTPIQPHPLPRLHLLGLNKWERLAAALAGAALLTATGVALSRRSRSPGAPPLRAGVPGVQGVRPPWEGPAPLARPMGVLREAPPGGGPLEGGVYTPWGRQGGGARTEPSPFTSSWVGGAGFAEGNGARHTLSPQFAGVGGGGALSPSADAGTPYFQKYFGTPPKKRWDPPPLATLSGGGWVVGPVGRDVPAAGLARMSRAVSRRGISSEDISM